MTATIQEVYGKSSVGDRVWEEGQPYRVSKVIRQSYWSDDRIDDEDEFGLAPGWYSTVEIEPDQMSAAEEQHLAAEKAEKDARRAAAAAEAREYRERLAELAEAHAAAIVGLEPAGSEFNRSVLADLAAETVGRADQPGSGCSGVTELDLFRDASGAIQAVSFGCPYDLGPSYWLSKDLIARSRDKKRVWKWWSPTTHGIESYPGPGVPLEEMTEEERAEVDRLESERLAAVRAEELRLVPIRVRQALEDAGLLVREHYSYTPQRPCEVRAIEWSFDVGPNFEAHIQKMAAWSRAHSHDRPPGLDGLVVRVKLPAEAFVKKPKSRKPAVVEGLPRQLTCLNHCLPSFEVIYEPA